MADVADVPDTAIAAPRTCIRCGRQALLNIVGRCADCVAELGLRHPDEYEAWKADVAEEFGRK